MIKQQGITLIEYTIYIGIVAFVLLSSVTFAWVIIDDQTKQQSLVEVNDMGSFVSGKIGYAVRRAESIDELTTYDVNPGRLMINYQAEPQITFDTYQKEITLGDETFFITKLRRQEGANPAVDITSDLVNVTEFIITDLSTASIVTLQLTLGIERVNPSNDKTYEAVMSWTPSFSVREP